MNIGTDEGVIPHKWNVLRAKSTITGCILQPGLAIMNETHIQIELDCLYMSFFILENFAYFLAQAFPWAFPVSCHDQLQKEVIDVKEYLSSIEDVLKEQNSSEQGLIQPAKRRNGLSSMERTS